MTEFLKSFKFNFRYTIAMIVIVCTFGSLYMLAHFPIPDGNKELYSVALGIVLNGTLGPVMRALFPPKEEPKPKTHTP